MMILTFPQLQAMLPFLASTSSIYAYQLAKVMGSTRYPDDILRALERRGWLTSELEDFHPNGKPARRFYTPTTEGIDGTRQALSALGLAT